VKKPKGRQKRSKTKRVNDEQASRSRAAKRIRIHPPNPPPPTPSVRLRIPKGQRRQQEHEEPGLFDEILATEDRDTSKTAIAAPDKQKFEKSRAMAEVCSCAIPLSCTYTLPVEAWAPTTPAATADIRDSRYSHRRSILPPTPLLLRAAVTNPVPIGVAGTLFRIRRARVVAP
jgi:hypothetical protein